MSQTFYKERLNRTLITVVILLCVICFLVMLRVLIFGIKEMSVGDYANVIIAFSNVVMACAAIIAGYKANKWLSQKKLVNNLDYAHKISMEFEKNIWKINSRLFTDYIHIRSLKKIIESRLDSEENIKAKAQLEIDKFTTFDLDELATLYSSKSLLTRFNITLHSYFEREFKHIVKTRYEYLELYYSYIALLSVNFKNIECDEVKDAENKYMAKQKELAEIFGNSLATRPINNDYEFK